MSIELTTLRLLKHRDRYVKLIRSVPTHALDTYTKIILDDYGAFFKEFKEVDKIESGPFFLWFRGFRHKNLKEDSAELLGKLIKQIDEDVDPGVEVGLLNRLLATGMAYDLTTAITKFSDGEEVDLPQVVREVREKFELALDRKVRDPQVRDPIEDLLEAEANDVGLHWRLPCLNRHIKPIRGGDFVVVAARPDKGKTTFFASELTYMAAQVDGLYPGQNRCGLWLNNEGPGRNIVVRTFQGALNATIEEMAELSKAAAANPEYKSKLREDYVAAVGGRGGALRVMDIHGMWNYEVEELIARYNPAFVLFDMVDNIKFGGDVSNNGQRTDQLLEAMYQWARLLGVKYDCAMFATSQISAEGDGVMWPTLPMLKDSKTGKQGAADVIITIGTVNDPVLENHRYIGCTKNKRSRSGLSKSPQQVVLFDGDRGRYVECL